MGDRKLQCPVCSSLDVTTRLDDESVPYWVEVVPRLWLGHSFDVVVPVRTCQKCVYEWTDDEAAVIRRAAIEAGKAKL